MEYEFAVVLCFFWPRGKCILIDVRRGQQQHKKRLAEREADREKEVDPWTKVKDIYENKNASF